MLEVVVCTYNHAALLDGALTALARQRVPEDEAWSVLVVDNNCTDSTAAVVERHRGEGRIPDLRRVQEPEQGLTPARLRGVRDTTAPWIAFVDDDCVLDEGWVAGVLATAAAHPEAAAIGGKVVLRYERPPSPFVRDFSWVFAAQDHGDEPRAVDFLVGAGMVVSRAAVQECGWADGPLLADRVGAKLVSGGDVELALRVSSGGREIRYAPDCVLHHTITSARTSMRHLVPLVRGLGRSQTYADAMTFHGSFRGWVRDRGRRAVLDATFLQGRWQSMARLVASRVRGRPAIFGVARKRQPG